MTSNLFALRVRTLLPVLAASLLAATGCGQSGPALMPVAGRVLVDGKPAVGAAVVLHPVEATGESTRPLGQVDERGEFHLTTAKSGDGAAPGEYRVTVTWFTSTPASGKRVEGEDSPARNRLPAKYAQASTTPVTVTVKPDGTEPLRIDITTTRP